MKYIIKSQCYQLVRNRLVYVVFFILMLMQCTIFIGELDSSLNLQNVSVTGYISAMGAELSFLSVIFGLFFTAIVCGDDFVDKTANYEIMSGHSRREIYCAKAIVSMIGGTIGSLIIMLFPCVFISALAGFGDGFTVGNLTLRYLLAVFPVLRMICEFVFLSYIIKNAYVVMGLGFMTGMALPIFIVNGMDSLGIYSGLSGLVKVFNFSEWDTYTLVGQKDIVVYDATIRLGEVLPVVISSVVVGLLFLYMGYYFFKKDDLS